MSWKIMDASNLGWGGGIEDGWRKGPWTAEEDRLLIDYVRLHGEGRWNSVARLTGLKRNGKSCRLRWVNYLRPDLKRGQITPHEESIIIELHARWGNRWSTIARSLPGRTDNEIKNYWRTHFKQKSKITTDKATNRLLKRQRFRQQQEQQKQHQPAQLQHQQLLQLNQFDIKKIMSLLEVDNNEAKAPYCYVPQLTNYNNMYPNTTEDQGMVYNMFGANATSMATVPEATSTDEIAWEGLWNLEDYGHGSFGAAKFPPYKACVQNLVAPFC